ncbi:hypothetical protein J8J27_32375, partial [Mycobacterium tuberculosis]|nr:hypothetical protein [Mycobacterium tuberculosis]
LHGGAMSIDSRVGRGTTVTVRLPFDGPAEAGRVVALGDAEAAAPAAAHHATVVAQQQRQRRA